MSDTPLQTSTIPGWAVDADPRNDPTYPMRRRSKDDGPGMNWDRPTVQPETVEVLQSIEHVRRPAVFGDSSPPRGLSGAIRRRAFDFSESQWAHWLMLVAADRIDMVEGVIEDLARGKIPNLYEEMGLKAQWRYNRPAFMRRTAASALVAGAVTGYFLLRSRQQRDRAYARLA